MWNKLSRNFRTGFITVITFIILILLLGIAGNYDRQCAQEDAQVINDLIEEAKWMQDQE